MSTLIKPAAKRSCGDLGRERVRVRVRASGWPSGKFRVRVNINVRRATE